MRHFTMAFILMFAGIYSTNVALANNPALQAERLLIVSGKSVTLSRDLEIANLAVGNSEIADVVILSPKTFYILGKSLGTTNVQVFAPDGTVETIYDLVVGADLEETQLALHAAFPDHRIKAYSVNGGIRLAGSLPDTQAIERAIQIAQAFLRNNPGGELVINTLTISDPPQVFLSVQIIEVSRSVSQQLTSTLGTLNGRLDSSGFELSGGPLSSLSIQLEALSANGLARLLATPTLTAQSGEEASFLAGGEVPVQTPTEDGGLQTEYKEFGVRLNFRPQVMNGNTIRLELEPSVSQLDSVATASGNLPSFATRRVNTTVTLKNGESFVIAGLLQSNQSRGSDRFPLLGDLPIVGALFRDSVLNDTSTELMIIVTPTLTQPVVDASSIALPSDDRRAASGWDFFGTGLQEVSSYRLEDVLVGKNIKGSFGHVLNIGAEGVMVGTGR